MYMRLEIFKYHQIGIVVWYWYAMLVTTKECFFRFILGPPFSNIFLQALDLLRKRHGEVVRETFRSGVVKKWSHDTTSHGAFVMHGVLQRYQYQENLQESHGNIYFAGEYTNKVGGVIINNSLKSRFLP